MKSRAVTNLRLVARAEGASFLALLLIAMPIKYIFHVALLVRILGGLHGVLFLGFGSALFRATLEQKWSMRHAMRLGLLSLLPFGFLAIDRHLLVEPQENENGCSE
jgi:integral membrane protein